MEDRKYFRNGGKYQRFFSIDEGGAVTIRNQVSPFMCVLGISYWVFLMTFQVAIYGGVVWVACHFISKYW